MRFQILSLVILLLFISANNSFAKSKILPGYIITNSGDTIRGYFEYKKNKETPQKILFKKSEKDFGMLYTAKTISEFCVNNKIYKSAIVKIDQSPYKTKKIFSSPDFHFEVDTVFLQALILGEKDLYYLKDITNKIYFYIKNDSVYELLIHRKYLKKEDGKQKIAENNNYIGQLLHYFNNCASFNSVLSVTDYNMKSLTKVFKYYYEDTNSKIVYLENKKKRKVYFWLN